LFSFYIDLGFRVSGTRIMFRFTGPWFFSSADADEGETIYIPRVSTKILAMVIEYCHEHTKRWFQMGFIQAEEGLKTWDAEFITVDQATFFQLFLAAKYLKIQPLMQLTDEAVGNIIKGKTPEDVRVFFNIVSFFSQC